MSRAFLRGGSIGEPYNDALVHDTATHSPPALTKPGYLETTIDPVFGTMITRVTGNVGDTIPGFEDTWAESMMAVYPKMPAWSTPDGNGDSLLMIEYTRQTAGGYSWAPIFLDGDDYTPLYLRGANADPAHDVERGNRRWHPVLPDILVEVDNDSGTIRFWNVRTDSSVEVYRPSLGLSGTAPDVATIGSGEGNLSLDGRYVVLTYPGEGTNANFYVVDMTNCMPTPATDSAVKLGTTHTIEEMLGAGETMDWVSVSPLGTYILVSSGASLTRVFAWNKNTGEIQTPHLCQFSSGHFDLVVGQNGVEYALDGLGRYYSLLTGVRTTIWNNGSGHYHIGTHPGSGLDGMRGWGIASTYQLEGTAANELIAYSPNGTFYRLCHHRMSVTGGRVSGSPCAIPCPDGKRIFFGSDWGEPATYFCQGYIVDVRNLCG